MKSTALLNEIWHVINNPKKENTLGLELSQDIEKGQKEQKERGREELEAGHSSYLSSI